MLLITNMSEEIILFNFIDGLKSWVVQNLKHCGVNDISIALTVTKTIEDFEYHKSKNTSTQKEGKRDHSKDKKSKDTCFLCDGPRWARDCPKRKALNAMLEKKEVQWQSHMECLQLLNSLKANY